MLDITLQVTNTNAQRMVSLNEKFNLQLNNTSETRSLKSFTLDSGEIHNETCSDTDILILSATNPVSLVVDGLTVGNGKIFTLHKTSGIQSFSVLNGITSAFLDLTKSTIVYDYSARTLSLNMTGAIPYYIILDGTTTLVSTNKVTSSHANASGNYYCYLDESLVLTIATSLPLSGVTYIPVAYISFNSTDSTATFYSDERDVTLNPTASSVVKIALLK